MSFDSSHKKQEQAAPAKSPSQTGRRSSKRAKRALRATIEEYLLDHRSQNHSPKTLEWHTLALGNFADFLEKQGVTSIEDIESVHVLSWLTSMSTEPGAKGRYLEIRHVILSAAKDLGGRLARSFAALRMTCRTPHEAAHGKSSLQISRPRGGSLRNDPSIAMLAPCVLFATGLKRRAMFRWLPQTM